MTDRDHAVDLRVAAAALAGALLLGGCAATHVGNTWQCPLVRGSVCARVAEADPAAPTRVSMDAPANAGTTTEPSAVRAQRYRNATGARVPATRTASRSRESEPTCQGPAVRWIGPGGVRGARTRNPQIGATPKRGPHPRTTISSPKGPGATARERRKCSGGSGSRPTWTPRASTTRRAGCGW